VTADQAREHAQQILRERRFHGSSVPRPFHGILVWLGDELRPVGHLFDRLAEHLPGGSYTLWAILAGIVILLAAGLSARVASRRAAAELERRERARLPRDVDPRQLEREADEAERAGDPARALRLRFRAGLLRLGRNRVVPLRESLTSGEARRLVRLPEFDRLAHTHDEVVYGGRRAELADAVEARETWPRVLSAKGVAR
jgi:hypothetical protein